MVIRIYFVAACIVMITAGIVARLGYLSLVEKEFLQGQGDARAIRMELINAHRGTIWDSRGKPLAVSSPVISLWANPKEISRNWESPEKTNRNMDKVVLLAKFLGVTAEELMQRMEEARGRDFVYLVRRLPPPDARRILSLDLGGVFEEKEYHRYYPTGEVTAHLLGINDIEDRGQEGLELSFNKRLSGSPGRMKVLKDRNGGIVRELMLVDDAKPGQDLKLSIDLRVQYHAYRELKTAISHLGAKSGSIVILDVTTGQVLSMVNQPSFNPNNRKKLAIDAVKNRAVTDRFEPGSTVKPLTVAVALQSGYPIDTEINTSPGELIVGNFTVRDPRDYGILDLRRVIAKSSQVGISKLALKLDAEEVWEMSRKVGFGQSTGSGFPGESSGSLPNHTRWSDIERVTFAYGYGLMVTPLQLAGAYQVIASGGIKRDISLLHEGEVKETRVLDENIANSLRMMLKSVVTEGTATRAAIPGYQVAGKTGTVRKMGEDGYVDNRHLAFFVGMIPAEDPKLVGVVLVNEPRTKAYGGGAIAAPIFSRVMAGTLRLLGVPPDLPVADFSSKRGHG